MHIGMTEANHVICSLWQAFYHDPGALPEAMQVISVAYCYKSICLLFISFHKEYICSTNSCLFCIKQTGVRSGKPYV